MKNKQKNSIEGSFFSFFLPILLLTLMLGMSVSAAEVSQTENDSLTALTNEENISGSEGTVISDEETSSEEKREVSSENKEEENNTNKIREEKSSDLSSDINVLSEENAEAGILSEEEDSAWPGSEYASYTGLLKNEEDGKSYYILDGAVNTKANGLIKVNEEWCFFENGVLKESESNLILFYGGWYYIKNGKIDWNYSTLAQVNGKGTYYYVEKGQINWKFTGLKYIDGSWYYIEKGVWKENFNNLVYHYGGWYYVQNGKINWDYSNLVPYNGGWYYVKKGQIDWTYSTLAQVNGKGKWYCVQKGKLNWAYTGLAQNENGWFYVSKGVVDFSYSGLVNHYGGWYYIQKGYLNRNYSNLVKYNGAWYYVKKGQIDWTYTSLAQVDGKGAWYYVKKGQLDWTFTGLVNYYGGWYYIQKGVLNWNYSGLVYHYGGWYYVDKGKINWSYTNIVAYNGGYYYVEKGIVNWSYSGKATVNNKYWYYVLKGVVQTGRFQLSDGKWYQMNHSTGELYEAKAVIAIDAGHQSIINTGTEPLGPGSSVMKRKVSTGTAGYVTGQTEYSVNLAIALKLQAILEADGYTVVMIRTTNDVDISNAERAQIANNANADAFVRIHADGNDNHSVSGATTLCQTSSNPYNGSMASESYSLSNYILNSLSDATGCRKVGISQVDNMTGINWSKVPVSIVEVGFLSNASEDQLLATDSYRQKVARGIANGIEAYINSKN